MSVNRFLPAIIIGLFLNAGVSSFSSPIPLFPSLSVQDREILKETGELSLSMKPESPLFIDPSHAFGRILAVEREGMRPTDGIQLLCLWKFPAREAETEYLYLKIYNLMQCITSLKGLEYYSRTAGGYRVLFEEAYTVESPAVLSRIPDRVFAELPAFSRSYAVLTDSRFGTFTAEILYRSFPDGVALSMTNLTPLHFLGSLEVVEAAGLQIHLAVFPAGDELLLYGAAFSDMSGVPGFTKSKEESLYHRLQALYAWFRRSFTP